MLGYRFNKKWPAFAGRLALLAVSLCVANCGRDVEHAPPGPLDITGPGAVYLNTSSIEPLANLRARCLATRGRWNTGLVSCICPRGQLFNVGGGCQDAVLSPTAASCSWRGFSHHSREQLQRCLKDFMLAPSFEAHFDLEDYSNSELAALATALDRDPVAPMAGVTLPADADVVFPMLKLKKLNARVAGTSLMPWVNSSYLSSRSMTANPLLGLDEGAFDPAAFARDCQEAVRAASYPEDGGRACAATGEMLASLNGTRTRTANRALPLNFNEEGSACLPDCALTASAQVDEYALRYHVFMTGYAPIARMIMAAGPSDARLYTFVSPTGRFEAAVLKWSHVGLQTDRFLASSEYRVFDSRWNLLESRSEPRGDKKAFLEALANASSAEPLPTDGTVSPIDTPIRGLLIDSSIDPRVPGLRSRLMVNERAIADAVERGQIRENVLSYPRDTLSHTLDLVDQDHGTRVAALVAAGLPNLRLGLLRGSEVGIFGESFALRERWEAEIRRSEARVVNISMVFGRAITHCEAFFGELFSALPDVLFVVGAGNQGAWNPTGTCPAGIASAHANVLTVAGVNGRGEIDGDSNFGRQVAMVAAPFYADTVDVGNSMEPIREHLAQMSGTSVSAALTSNAALRMLAVDPSLRPAQIIGRMMAYCKNQRIDVQCGGEVDFAMMEDDSR